MTALTQTLSHWIIPKRARRKGAGLGLWKSLAVSLPMLLLTFVMLVGSNAGSGVTPLMFASIIVVWAAANVIFFLMLYTGQTQRYRSFLFSGMAIGFVIFFITNLLETRGSMALSRANMLAGETPFCHLVIPMIAIPAAFTRTIIFPGSLTEGFASVASMIVLWTGASLALGRGWCSWACFYGGLDEACSRLAKKPRLKNIDRRWTFLPWAVLLVIVLVSAGTLSPTYCEWFCPFKAVTEFVAITSLKVLFQTVIFVALFISTVLVLPYLTRRRIQCGLFCPLGALQSLTNKVKVFEIRIDPHKCSRCNHCISQCQTFSLDESSLESGRALLSCTKCGGCVDACPNNAISFHIKGTPRGLHPNLARVLFLYPAYLMLVTFGGGMVAMGLWRVLLLVSTGSMF